MALVLLTNTCQAGEFFSSVSEKLTQTKSTVFSVFYSQNSEKKINQKIRTDLSKEEIEELKKEVERKKIIREKENWRLTEHYCLLRSDYDNFLFCLEKLEEQKQACEAQKTYGNNIYISLNDQLLYAVKNCQLVAYSIVITGKNKTPTPTGTFHIYSARGPHYMQGEWFVNKAFYFWRGYALHDAGWRTGKYWEKEYRAYYGSHGCVNLPQKTMNILWDQYVVGDNVYVYYSLPEEIFSELKEKIGTKKPIISTDE